MPWEKSINVVNSPRDENQRTLVKDGKIIGSVTTISRDEVRLENTRGEVLGVYESTDLAVARIEEFIDLQAIQIDPLG